MSAPGTPKTKIELANELLALTRQMVQNKADADFLIEGVEKRQAIMDAYDALPTDPAAPDAAMRKMLRTIFDEVLRLDTAVQASLLEHRDSVKARLAGSNQRKKVLAYTNGAMSSSGSYMDYRQ